MQQEIQIPTQHDNFHQKLTIYPAKKNLATKGVVIQIPGSDGIGDIPFSNFRNFRKNSIYKAHPLASLFNRNGYAFVTFNTRGIDRLKDCLKNTRPSHLKQYFANNCIDEKIRKNIDWERIETDITMITAYFRNVFEGQTLGYLTISEGGTHAFRLIRKEMVKPDFIIGLGVPTSSPLENARQQVSSAIYINKLLQFMSKKSLTEISTSQIETLFPHMLSLHKTQFRMQFVGERISRDQLTIKLAENLNEFERKAIEIMSLKRSDAVSADMDGIEIPSFSSVAWWQDSLMDDIPLCTSITGYAGNVHLFFGEFDSQVARGDETCEDRSGRSTPLKLTTYQISNTGHSLLDQHGNYTIEFLRKLEKILVTPQVSASNP